MTNELVNELVWVTQAENRYLTLDGKTANLMMEANRHERVTFRFGHSPDL